MPEPYDIDVPEPPLFAGTVPLARAPVPRRTAHFSFALSVALLAHVVAAAALLTPTSQDVGAVGGDRDAISIDVMIVPATALETRVSAPAAAATSGTIDSDPVQSIAALPVAETPRPEALAVPAPDLLREPVVMEPLSPTPSVIAAELPPPPDPEPPIEITPQRAVARSPAASPTASSGVASVGMAETAVSMTAAAAAAPGVAERYARSVVEALGKSRPKGATAGQRGTVKVTFAIADSGALKFARVTASSGSTTLDSVALSAVQRVSFPTPPVGLSLAQLTYEIPYRFR